MINWIYRALGKESASRRQESGRYGSVQSGNLISQIRASKELGDPFGIARVRHPDAGVLESILEAVGGEYSSVRKLQVSFVTYLKERELVDQLSKFVQNPSGLEVQLTWYDNPSDLRIGDMLRIAHETQGINKSYEIAKKSA